MSLHDGHRSRMRERLLSEGLSSFEPHEVLELLLFYAIPLRNVNPLAHELIATFGSLAGVLAAPKELLACQPGVGASTAEWLSQIGPILDTYLEQRLGDRPFLDRLSRAAAYGDQLFADAQNEQLWVVNMNQVGHLLHSAKMCEGEDMMQRLDMRELVDTTLRYHAQSVVIMQRRLPARMKPVEADIRFTSQLNDLLRSIGVHLVDNVMLCGHRRTSLRASGAIQLADPPAGGLEEPAYQLALHWLDEA